MKIQALTYKPVFLMSSTGRGLLNLFQLKVSVFLCCVSTQFQTNANPTILADSIRMGFYRPAEVDHLPGATKECRNESRYLGIAPQKLVDKGFYTN